MSDYKINTKIGLQSFITRNWDQVNEYISNKQIGLPIPFYCSVDIRESEHKFAPIDHNLYPAGFNNLCQKDIDELSSKLHKYISENFTPIKTIGIIPEFHTKNAFYLDHLAILKKSLQNAGYAVHLINLNQDFFPKLTNSIHYLSHSKYELIFEKGRIINGYFHLDSNPNLKMDLIILNNDQSSPLDIEWDELKVKVIPSPKMGWFWREKSSFFISYEKVVSDFSNYFSVDPDLIMAKYKTVECLDFFSKKGFGKLAQAVDELKTKLPADSKVFVKAGKGTYGMGISVVSSGEQILQMNRKQRNKMDSGKSHLKFTTAIVQEGIETIIRHEGMPGEITIYLLGGKSIGGFLRANPLKDSNSNLNSKGMVFKKICISDLNEDKNLSPADDKCKEAVYCVISRLATIASAIEISQSGINS